MRGRANSWLTVYRTASTVKRQRGHQGSGHGVIIAAWSGPGWTSPSHQFLRTQGEKQPSQSHKQPGQTVKAADLACTMSGALGPGQDVRHPHLGDRGVSVPVHFRRRKRFQNSRHGENIQLIGKGYGDDHSGRSTLHRCRSTTCRVSSRGLDASRGHRLRRLS